MLWADKLHGRPVLVAKNRTRGTGILFGPFHPQPQLERLKVLVANVTVHFIEQHAVGIGEEGTTRHAFYQVLVSCKVRLYHTQQIGVVLPQSHQFVRRDNPPQFCGVEVDAILARSYPRGCDLGFYRRVNTKAGSAGDDVFLVGLDVV